MAAIPAFFGLLLAVVLIGHGESQEVVISPLKAVKKVGEDLEVICRVSYAITSCNMKVGGKQYILPEKKTKENDEGEVTYAGKGYQFGECGALLRGIQEEWNGNVTCLVPSSQGTVLVEQTMELIVARAPSLPQLVGARESPYREGEHLQLQCLVQDGRPAATLNWYKDSILLPRGAHKSVETVDPITGLITVSQNVTLAVSADDSGHKLECRAQHYAWDQPKEAAVQINVNFPPRRVDGAGPSITIFGLALGEPGLLNVTVQSSPQPQGYWTVGGQRLAPGQSSPDGTVKALPALSLGNNTYNITLLLSRVTKEDVERAYHLTVNNEIGRDEYEVTITTMAEPAGVELDAGSIVGIVVGVLVLLLAVFLVVFARATHRWCFAGRARETKSSGESSDTESATAPASSPRSRLAALGKRVRAALPRRDKGATVTDSAPTDDKASAEEKKGVVYAELALGERGDGETAPPPPATGPPADYAEIVYTTEGDKDSKTAKE